MLDSPDIPISPGIPDQAALGSSEHGKLYDRNGGIIAVEQRARAKNIPEVIEIDGKRYESVQVIISKAVDYVKSLSGTSAPYSDPNVLAIIDLRRRARDAEAIELAQSLYTHQREEEEKSTGAPSGKPEHLVDEIISSLNLSAASPK